jgi:hypothetical protein
MSLAMRTWIDERSFDELSAAAVPTEKYKFVVEMIQRDQSLFRSDNTLLDMEVYRMKEELDTLVKRQKDSIKLVEESDTRRNEKEKELIAFREFVERKSPQVNELQTQEELSKYNTRTRKLATLEKSFQTMDKNHKLLLLEQLDMDDRLELVKKLYPILEEVRMWTAKRFVSLNRAAQEYKRNHDVDKLKRSVHWICEYGDAMIDRAARDMPEYMSKILTRTPTRVDAWKSSVSEEEASTTTEDF